MAKSRQLNQRQWLNIIILVISALVLLFVMVGRVMQHKLPQSQPVTSQIAITRIDFGNYQIWMEQQTWHSSHQSLTASQASQLATRWEQLLTQPAQPMTENTGSGQLVVLYLAAFSQPIMAKISRLENKTRISFITSRQQLLLDGDDFELYFPRLE